MDDLTWPAGGIPPAPGRGWQQGTDASRTGATAACRRDRLWPCKQRNTPEIKSLKERISNNKTALPHFHLPARTQTITMKGIITQPPPDALLCPQAVAAPRPPQSLSPQQAPCLGTAPRDSPQPVPTRGWHQLMCWSLSQGIPRLPGAFLKF